MKQKYILNIVAILITLLLVFFLIFKVEATVFCHINNMERLVKIQEDIIEYISPYISKVSHRIKNIAVKKYIDRIRIENSIAKENVTLFLANPVNCYILIKRLTRDLHYVETILKQNTNYEENVNKSILHYPNEGNFNHAVTLIVLLVYVYEITENEFSNGKFTYNFSLPMTSSDCYEVALQAYYMNQHQIAIDWYDEAIRKYAEDCQDGDCLLTESDLKRKQKLALDRMFRPVSYSPFKNEVNEEKDDRTEEESISLNVQWPYLRNNFCQQEQRSPIRLHCQYKYGPHPFLRLARFKTEQMYVNPDITMFHDVISDEEINILKSIAENEINNTTETLEADPSFRTLQLRHIVYVDDEASRVSAVVSRRSLDISGLTHTMASDTKIVNYGAAGYHRSHTDKAAVFFKILNETDKYQSYHLIAQATVLYYLSEPDLGGATCFEDISVFPLKKAALYWRTLDMKSGHTDYRTAHTSCPVLHGSKWVAAKWLSTPDVLEGLKKESSDYSLPFEFKPLSYETVSRLENIWRSATNIP